MRIRRREQIKVSSSLMLTPMLDMLTVVLIFLIVNFSPEKASIKETANIQLPKSETQLSEVPKIQLELTKDSIKVNGESIEGVNPSMTAAGSWDGLRRKLAQFETRAAEEKTQDVVIKKDAILLIADRETPYEFVDRTVAHLASNGYSEVYLLTQHEETLQ